MKTKLITQSNWPTFFDRFSQRYEGCLVTLEILSAEIGAQVEQQDLPLAGITDEWDEIKGNSIMIMLGTRIGNHVTHNINRPREVSLEQTDEGKWKLFPGSLRWLYEIESELSDAILQMQMEK